MYARKAPDGSCYGIEESSFIFAFNNGFVRDIQRLKTQSFFFSSCLSQLIR